MSGSVRKWKGTTLRSLVQNGLKFQPPDIFWRPTKRQVPGFPSLKLSKGPYTKASFQLPSCKVGPEPDNSDSSIIALQYRNVLSYIFFGDNVKLGTSYYVFLVYLDFQSHLRCSWVVFGQTAAQLSIDVMPRRV